MSAVEVAIHLLIHFTPYYDWITVPTEEEGTHMATYTGSYELRKLTVSWSRTPAVGVVQDADMCTFHFVKLSSGAPDASWDATNYGTVETAADAFWTAIKANYATQTKLSLFTWRADGPSFRPHGSSLSPTLRQTVRSVAGTGGSDTSQLPPQCALSVTEVIPAHYTAYGVGVPGSEPGTGRTQSRNRWGRFYLPAPQSSSLMAGRFISTVTDAVSLAVKNFYNACVTANLVPVVYSPTTGSSWSIESVHVDDIVDVIRSRRYITPTTRSINNINPPS
jgi:hypothetical protein